MALKKYSLDDKYSVESGAAYMSGIQALVRLPIEQMLRDRRRALNTACFISGYQGSPLGGYDSTLLRAQKHLAPHNIHFSPGVNEDLAMTAVMGSQLFERLPKPTVDGVVGIWYGKGPGVDRSGDVLRHASFAGTGENCGALALAGDDHVSKSSTIPHQSELSFYNFSVPVLSASNTQEVLDYGLYGIEMSRFSGAWGALKLATDLCDGGGIVEYSPERCPVVTPELLIDGEPYTKMMATMLVVPYSLGLEADVHYHRLEAARVFARENGLNRITVRHENDRLGIITCGKSYADLMSALRALRLREADLERMGVRVLKMGMVFPLEPRIIDEFAAGLDNILVVEEKRSFVEFQLRELLFNRSVRPSIFGKTDLDGNKLLPSTGELDAGMIALVLGRFIDRTPLIDTEIEKLERISKEFAKDPTVRGARKPSYCSGCPHNRSTLLLEGQIAGGGIGCHGMAGLMSEVSRGIEYIFQMGSEGAAWIGSARFSGQKHIFQNLGDGTYFHSGRMAIQAAIDANVNITFKLLYNDAVAMTGGQTAAGGLPVPAVTRELDAQGVKKIILVSDDTEKYADRSMLAPSVDVRERDELEDVLRELETVEGVSVMIYDQMCAAEKRRRRNRGILPKPVRRIMINERVCEGCGDCVKHANCVSLLPVETDFGPKTRIHQSSCNSDYTCTWGDCPSFVSVMIEEGSGLKRQPLPQLPTVKISEPATKVEAGDGYHILMPGVGGTGVVTMNAMLATAALLDGRHSITLDQTGVAQKGGAVVAHLTLSERPIESSQRINAASLDLMLGFDLVGAAYSENLKCCDRERTVAIINSKEILTGDAIRKGLTVLSADGGYLNSIRGNTRENDSLFVDASTLADTLFGGHVFTNVFLVGVAYQKGLLPLTAGAIEEAIRMNGIAVERNLEVFAWGRRFVDDPSVFENYLPRDYASAPPRTLDELIADREAELTAYHNAGYAAEYRRFVDRARVAEQRVSPGGEALTRAVAWNLHKLMAYKDEYEVARLLTDASFQEKINDTFDKPAKVIFHLHPPLLRTFGFKKKMSFGPWFRPVLQLMASSKALRGTAFDPFGWMPSRREERELIAWYRSEVGALVDRLDSSSIDLATTVAGAPEGIRGYEQVKRESIARVKAAVADHLQEAAQRAAA